MSPQEIQNQHQSGVENGWVLVGAFSSTHGVRGDIKLRSFTGEPQAIFDFEQLYVGKNGPALIVHFSKVAKGMLVVSVEGVTSKEEAQALVGADLYVPRDAFANLEDEDEFYMADLIGLRVKSPGGKEIGTVRAVENFGADDLVDILLKEPAKGLGRSLLVPFTVGYVPKVNIAGGQLVLDLDAWVADQIESPKDEGPEDSDRNE